MYIFGMAKNWVNLKKTQLEQSVKIISNWKIRNLTMIGGITVIKSLVILINTY